MTDLSALTVVPPTSFEDSKLNAEKRAYAYWRGVGLTPVQALKRAGMFYTGNAFSNSRRAVELEADPQIRQVIDRIYEENRYRYEIDRDRVVEGLMESINVAREQSDSTAMINGWKELAKVTGVGAPERKEIVLSQTNPSTEALKQAPDDELLKLVGKERSLQLAEPIEDAEFEEIPRGEAQ